MFFVDGAGKFDVVIVVFAEFAACCRTAKTSLTHTTAKEARL